VSPAQIQAQAPPVERALPQEIPEESSLLEKSPDVVAEEEEKKSGQEVL